VCGSSPTGGIWAENAEPIVRHSDLVFKGAMLIVATMGIWRRRTNRSCHCGTSTTTWRRAESISTQRARGEILGVPGVDEAHLRR
jgi:hypothetical protein